MATYRTQFEVLGRAPFPVDMLRYDGCYPGDDLVVALQHPEPAGTRGQQTYRLYKVHEGRDPRLTPGRWQSFGWGIVPNMTVTEKIGG